MLPESKPGGVQLMFSKTPDAASVLSTYTHACPSVMSHGHREGFVMALWGRGVEYVRKYVATGQTVIWLTYPPPIHFTQAYEKTRLLSSSLSPSGHVSW